ncbi:hypothetical protein ACLMJK_005604 [Lecanora helva]
MAPFPSPTSTWHSNTYPSISPTRPELSAKGKSVIITGGGTGIGAETAHQFAAAGTSRIAILGRRMQPLLDTKASIERKHPSVEVFIASTDVTKQSDVDTAFADFVGKEGKIDVLVSNAATVGPKESVRDVDRDAFCDAITKNMRASLLTAQAFLRHATSDAVVIEINSSAAHVEFGPGLISYSVSKLGIVRMWDSLAFANPGMRVFHLQPGIIRTAMNQEAGGIDSIGIEDDVSLPAGFAVWLASPEARFLKGKFLWANWDVDELKAQAKMIEESSFLNIGLNGFPFQEAGWKPQWDM